MSKNAVRRRSAPEARRRCSATPNPATTLKIYMHALRREADDSADRLAVLAGLRRPSRETLSDAEGEDPRVSDCSDGGPCRTRTYNQRIKSPLLYQLS